MLGNRPAHACPGLAFLKRWAKPRGQTGAIRGEFNAILRAAEMHHFQRASDGRLES